MSVLAQRDAAQDQECCNTPEQSGYKDWSCISLLLPRLPVLFKCTK